MLKTRTIFCFLVSDIIWFELGSLFLAGLAWREPGVYKIGQIFLHIFIDPPDEGDAQMDDPTHSAGLKIVDPPPPATIPQKWVLCCWRTHDNTLVR